MDNDKGISRRSLLGLGGAAGAAGLGALLGNDNAEAHDIEVPDGAKVYPPLSGRKGAFLTSPAPSIDTTFPKTWYAKNVKFQAQGDAEYCAANIFSKDGNNAKVIGDYGRDIATLFLAGLEQGTLTFEIRPNKYTIRQDDGSLALVEPTLFRKGTHLMSIDEVIEDQWGAKDGNGNFTQYTLDSVNSGFQRMVASNRSKPANTSHFRLTDPYSMIIMNGNFYGLVVDGVQTGGVQDGKLMPTNINLGFEFNHVRDIPRVPLREDRLDPLNPNRLYFDRTQGNIPEPASVVLNFYVDVLKNSSAVATFAHMVRGVLQRGYAAGNGE